MKAKETKQLKEAISTMKACFDYAEIMAERAKERETWSQILTQMNVLLEPLELYESVWVNKFEDLSERQQESPKGEHIEDVARKYEEIVDELKSLIHNLEYLVEDGL